MPDRPNILLITSDQHRADHLSIAGLEAIQTPNLDRLGREGCHIGRAYTCSPVCTPARVSLLTGQYPSRHGAYSIGVTTEPFPTTTVPGLLAQAGYRTALFGKSHFVETGRMMEHITGQADPDPAFFRTFTGPYVGFDEVRLSRGHTTNCVPDMHYRCFLEDHAEDWEKWFPHLQGDYDHSAAGPWDLPAHLHDSTWVGNETCAFIEREQDTDRPWFAWASLQDPHEPHVCPHEWYERVPADNLPLLEPYREGEFEGKPAFYTSAYEEDWGVGTPWNDAQSVPCAHRRDTLESRKHAAMRATLGMVLGIDEQIGRVLATLEQTGQAQNTLVIYTSDHGEYHGHHGFWGKGLPAFEDAQRVPMLAWGPGHVRALGTQDTLASLIDVPRTVLDLAEVPLPRHTQGESLLPLLRGEAEAVRDEVLVELRAIEKFSQHTLVNDRHKLVVYETLEEGELYDLEQDPDQYHNLWSEPSAAGIRCDMLLRLARHYQVNEGRQIERKSFS